MKFKNAFLALALLTMPMGAVSCSNASPKAPQITIGDNGNWFVDGKDTGQSSKGDTGAKGDSGEAPEITIGENGNWFIGGKDTGLSSKGDSAYEIFKKQHPDVNITEEEWLHDFIKGDLDKYTYQHIQFKVDGSLYKEFKVDYGGTVPTFKDPTKENQCFAGWFDENGKKFRNNNIIDDHTYYARFKNATPSDANDLNFNDVQMPAKPTGYNEHGLLNSPQDGTILHAWSWGLKEIKKEMKNIAAAGYSSVQTSPMQPQKDYYPNNSIKWWWKVYQPLGFEIATKDNSLGTKQDLIELCEEADKYGVKVIVDVVANHLAGGSENTTNPDSQEYEPEIINNNLIHAHGKKEYCDDSDPYRTTKFPLGGYPDVQTENPKVQRAILGLLNEYVECGVDGFRFDAAKHIELPEDPEGVRSDFWDIAIKGSAKHAMDLGMDVPYSYGEILYSPGNGRSFSDYTKRISVTDNTAANQALSCVRNQDASSINRNDVYNVGIPANKAVLWGESHDTYANDNRETTDIPQKMVDKAYAINASRKDATSLYFIRPHEFSDSPTAMTLGGKSYDQHWKSNAITEVNKFHNRTVNCPETIESDDQRYFANYKMIDDKYAAMIVNLTDNNILSNYDALGNLGEGKYRDAVSGNLFTVSGGNISGTFDETGIACLYQEGKVTAPISAPRLKVSKDGSYFNNVHLDVNLNVENASSAYYQIDNGEKVPFTGSKDIVIGTDNFVGDVILKVHAENAHKTIDREFTYQFVPIDKTHVIAEKIDNEKVNGNKVMAYVFDKTEKKPGDLTPHTSPEWRECKVAGNNYWFEVRDTDTHFIICAMPNDTQIDQHIWDNVYAKTDDIPLGDSPYYDCSNFYYTR